jgi:hypothetical protein
MLFSDSHFISLNYTLFENFYNNEKKYHHMHVKNDDMFVWQLDLKVYSTNRTGWNTCRSEKKKLGWLFSMCYIAFMLVTLYNVSKNCFQFTHIFSNGSTLLINIFFPCEIYCFQRVCVWQIENDRLSFFKRPHLLICPLFLFVEVTFRCNSHTNISFFNVHMMLTWWHFFIFFIMKILKTKCNSTI